MLALSWSQMPLLGSVASTQASEWPGECPGATSGFWKLFSVSIQGREVASGHCCGPFWGMWGPGMAQKRPLWLPNNNTNITETNSLDFL